MTKSQIAQLRLGERLEIVARKADLLSLALSGMMSLSQSDQAWPLRDAADAIATELDAIAKEARK